MKSQMKCYHSFYLHCPNASPALTVLSSYSQAPSHKHYRSVIQVLKYSYNTCNYGISFHSNAPQYTASIHALPHHHDKEAYHDATPPAPGDCVHLTGFRNTCWGVQFSNGIPDGIPLLLFKYRSISGFVIFRPGGGTPIARTKQLSAHARLKSSPPTTALQSSNTSKTMHKWAYQIPLSMTTNMC